MFKEEKLELATDDGDRLLTDNNGRHDAQVVYLERCATKNHQIFDEISSRCCLLSWKLPVCI